MVRRTARRIRQNAVAWLALFVALGGTSAYAANTIGTGDIIDDQVTSPDVRDDTLVFGGLAAQDLGTGSVRSSEVLDGSIAGADVQNGTITGSDVASNTLTGLHINESALNLPPSTTATFAFGSANLGDAMTKVASKTLPAGSYALIGTASIFTPVAFTADLTRDTACELRNGSGFIGGTDDRRTIPDGQRAEVSLTMNGGALVSAGGGEVSLWCRWQGGGASASGQVLILRLDGFS